MGSMHIDPAGWPFIGGSLLFAILAEWFIGPGGATIFLVLTCFFLFFFRDPDRPITGEAGAVLSPADGRVTADDGVSLQSLRKRVARFLPLEEG